MTSRIIFSNHGEIDPRLITLMGVNVKPRAEGADQRNPFGFFGTGLKYAIAVSLRLNQRVTIMSGLKTMTFDRQSVDLRGKAFDQIMMTTVTPAASGGTTTSRQSLGFTTELGKQWEAWMAFREFYCNAVDEGGQVTESTLMPTPTAGQTYVIVEGAAMAQAYRRRNDWLLESKPIGTFSAMGYEVECHPSPRGLQQGIFYQNILVGKLEKPSLYTWNLLSKQERQLKSVYEVERQIIHCLARDCKDKELLRKIILAPEGTLEGKFYWNHAWSPSDELVAVVDELFDKHYGKLPGSLLELVKGRLKARDPAAVTLTRVQEMMLQRAKAACARIGQQVNEEIVIVESLGSQWLHGLAKDGRIILPLTTFNKGTKYLASTLLEEHLHCSLGLADCSRELQDWLFDRVLSLAEEMTGEPL